MVGRLLERYALSMDEIEVREARCVQAEVPMGGKRRRPVDARDAYWHDRQHLRDYGFWLDRGARPKKCSGRPSWSLSMSSSALAPQTK